MSFNSSSNTNARRIEPIAIPKPPPSSSSSSDQQHQQPIHRQHVQERYYAGNVQLMEARVMQLSSTVRALYRSIQELQVAIDEERNDTTATTATTSKVPDPDFVDAIAENTGLIERHKKELDELIVAMHDAGASSAEVPDDINVIDVPSLKQRLKQYLTAISTTAATANDRNSSGGGNTDGGIYL